jgi:hypothetical protein
MRALFAVAILALSATPVWAQTAQSSQTTVVLSPFQSLGNIIRNPDAPPQAPQTGTSEPLRLPTAIPPNTVGTNPNTPGR